jgi:hypothetical protein
MTKMIPLVTHADVDLVAIIRYLAGDFEDDGDEDYEPPESASLDVRVSVWGRDYKLCLKLMAPTADIMGNELTLTIAEDADH